MYVNNFPKFPIPIIKSPPFIVKNSNYVTWGSCLWFISRSPESRHFFGKFTVELVLKSFLARNSSVEVPVVPYGLEELRMFRALISWVLG